MSGSRDLTSLAARAEAGSGDGTSHRLSRDRDIILEAINEFDQFMLDDDFDYRRTLYKIMHRMKDRIALAAQQQDRPIQEPE